MPLPANTLHYPVERVLLQRTRLAYVHLRNLLTDAKRDRAARVYAYVMVWLPEELLLLFLQEGEVVNATATADGAHFRALPIGEALGKVPSAAEFGDICFHCADDEQLATMYWSQVLVPVAWPTELLLDDASAVLAFLHATMHDGVVEVLADGGVNYVVFRQGVATRGFFAYRADGSAEQRLRALLDPARKAMVQLWPVPPALPVQVPPALIRAYRELMAAVVKRLGESGTDGAPAHPLLDPATGAPAFTGIVQATAKAPTAFLAEVYSKLALLSGPEQAPSRLPYGGVLVLDDGRVEVVETQKAKPRMAVAG